jgi:hypothetical protein
VDRLALPGFLGHRGDPGECGDGIGPGERFPAVAPSGEDLTSVDRAGPWEGSKDVTIRVRRGFAVLTKTRAGTASRRDVRAALEEAGLLPVLETEIPLREGIAGSERTTPAALDASTQSAPNSPPALARVAR